MPTAARSNAVRNCASLCRSGSARRATTPSGRGRPGRNPRACPSASRSGVVTSRTRIAAHRAGRASRRARSGPLQRCADLLPEDPVPGVLGGQEQLGRPAERPSPRIADESVRAEPPRLDQPLEADDEDGGVLDVLDKQAEQLLPPSPPGLPSADRPSRKKLPKFPPGTRARPAPTPDPPRRSRGIETFASSTSAAFHRDPTNSSQPSRKDRAESRPFRRFPIADERSEFRVPTRAPGWPDPGRRTRVRIALYATHDFPHAQLVTELPASGWPDPTPEADPCPDTMAAAPDRSAPSRSSGGSSGPAREAPCTARGRPPSWSRRTWPTRSRPSSKARGSAGSPPSTPCSPAARRPGSRAGPTAAPPRSSA